MLQIEIKIIKMYSRMCSRIFKKRMHYDCFLTAIVSTITKT